MKICRPNAKMCIEFLYSIKWRVGGENNLQNYFQNGGRAMLLAVRR